MKQKNLRRRRTDQENPEWTQEDIRNARSFSDLADELGLKPPAPGNIVMVNSTPRVYRGSQKMPRKVPVSLRLSPEIVAAFKRGGPGWQSRIDHALGELVRAGRV